MAALKEGMEGIAYSSTNRTTSNFASNDYIQLYRTNGQELAADVKISKSVLMDCIQSALGTLLNGGTAQTTGITKVPSLVGNALGATSVANLSSVLCGLAYVKTIPSSEDMNNITGVGSYLINSMNHPSNMPSFIDNINSCKVLVVNINNGSSIIQLVFSLNGKIGWRVRHDNSSWYGWFQI